MIHMEPIQVGEHTFIGVEVKLSKTTLLTISNSRGYTMCGASNMYRIWGNKIYCCLILKVKQDKLS
ncbi:hypothetical protein SKN87_08005 [Paenibacillus polymyxa]|uniref:Uncharacterized protein n=1 Tax=Paenibacillus polymyxa (strain SC2) TaxID=886882 RepID=E3EII7_PAEPS|nr:hypothetical protein [Paenibacillus polymyxa]ADO55625.2 hypothetical protein PPSC2_07830 [Paenibacillus polymyxa SC2]WPQ59459.1 hypothetical protein SKN87_08005 [Paenibacillus polymyxa]